MKSTPMTSNVRIGSFPLEITDKGEKIHVSGGKYANAAMLVLQNAVQQRFPGETGEVYGSTTSHWNFDIATGIDLKKKAAKDAPPQTPKVSIGDVVEIAASLAIEPSELARRALAIKKEAHTKVLREQAGNKLQTYMAGVKAALKKHDITLSEHAEADVQAALADAYIQEGLIKAHIPHREETPARG